MISLVPRPSLYDAPTPSVALGIAVAGEAARTPRLKPVEAGEPTAPVRREREEAVVAARPSAEAATEGAVATKDAAQGVVVRPSMAWSGLASAPFVAQLIGQQSHQGDQMVAARGPTSYRKSPIELYEQAHGWARRIEFLFALDERIIPAAA